MFTLGPFRLDLQTICAQKQLKDINLTVTVKYSVIFFVDSKLCAVVQKN
jgi:hypothetical protein